MIVSGEQFQLQADIGFYSETNCIIEEQINKIKQNIYKISNFNKKTIAQYRKIFIYTHFSKEFMNIFLPFIGKDTVIITHNSDAAIDSSYLTYIENNNIKKWYCQNKETKHEKLISIPIGLANSQWVHGNQNLIYSIKEEHNIKTNFVYKNFDLNTNFNERHECEEITSQNKIYHSPKVGVEEYWRNLSKSYFAISPPGNGIDCHRIWECLFLQTIPVVKKHIAFEQFSHLPILFIDDWRQVTLPFLTEQLKRFENVNWDLKELKIDYWKNLINS